MRKKTSTVLILGTILSVFFLTGGPCYSSDGAINGCYKKVNGQLRIMTDHKGCTPSETPISWNQTASQGTAGPMGPVGPMGPTGPIGPAGPAGSFDLSNSYVMTCTNTNDPTVHYDQASNDCYCNEGDVALSAAVSCFIVDSVCTPMCFPVNFVGFNTVLTYEENTSSSGNVMSGYKARCYYLSTPEGYSIKDFPSRIDLRCAKP